MTRKTFTATVVAALFIGLSIQASAGEFCTAMYESNPQSGPVLSVSAPPDAKNVTAYFPFGLIRTLRLDEIRGRWSGRVMAQRLVPEGVYKIKIRIEHANGRIESRTVDYCLDSAAPEFEVHAPQATYGGEMLPVEVDPFEQVDKVYAYIPGVSKKQFRFSLDPNEGTYKAMIQMPDQFQSDKIIIRIVVRDPNSNYLLRAIDVWDLDLLEEYGDSKMR